MARDLTRREKLRIEAEARAWNFWYDFNQSVERDIRKSWADFYKNSKPPEIEWARSHGHTLENELKQTLLTTEEIASSLKRASIAGLLVMNPKNKGRVEESGANGFAKVQTLSYQQTLTSLKFFYDEYNCKRCVMHYFDYPLFDGKSAGDNFVDYEILRTHPHHKISELHMVADSYLIIGGPMRYDPANMPEINKIRKKIEKLERAEDKLEIEENPTKVTGDYALNEQVMRDTSDVFSFAEVAGRHKEPFFYSI